MTFHDFFKRATQSETEPDGRVPFPYQNRFAMATVLPQLLRVPTGAGKTATAVLGWLWRWTTRPNDAPRRLIYCLPMRVLVEQSECEAKKWIAKLNIDIDVQVLMGGVESAEWYLHPERPAILIGTQDMLLSRALNRGYAASRFHWPIDFGLLNNDCLWIFDEPQLMGSGVSTSAQLAGLRHTLGVFGNCPSVWMSATLERSWLNTVDFRGKFPGEPLELDDEDYDPNRPLHKRMTAKKTLSALGLAMTKEADDKESKAFAAAVIQRHQAGTQTLVVLNTVKRATKVYQALVDALKKVELPKLLLIHSRFRPAERSELNRQLQQKGDAAKDRIIVSTQVVEAGVDISSRTLITELAPWSSIVQRIGRCNRTDDDGPGQVFWIDLDEKLAPPYETADLDRARKYLKKLDAESVSPKALDDFKQKEQIILPFEHKHVLRRRDLLDLFDTAPDLSGNDIDIQRFVRGDDEGADVQVLWRDAPPDNGWQPNERRRQEVRREERCNVPIGSFKNEFLEAGKTAFQLDYIDGKWRQVSKREISTIVPGQTFWLLANQGGYDRQVGWKANSGPLAPELLIPLPDQPRKRRFERPEGFYDSDEWAAQAEWRSLAEHTEEVVNALGAILSEKAALPLSDLERAVLRVAARWHDWGKRHAIFQSGLAQQIDDPQERKEQPDLPKECRKRVDRPEKWRTCTDIAKAPDEFWQRYKRVLRPASNEQLERKATVKRFRHELASALGVLRLLAIDPPKDWATLAVKARWLALYLIAAHHGKVRLSIRGMPGESPIPEDNGRMFASGLWDGDELKAADLGGGVRTARIELSLQPMQLGGDDSWTANVLKFLSDNQLGPFRLAYLEALLRAADCRASDEGDSDE